MKASTLVCCFSGKKTNQCIKNGSGRLEVFCEKGVLRNFAKFTGNTCARVSFLIKLQAAPATLLKKGLWHRCFPVCNFIKKETLAQVFSCEFCEISKNTFFIEHLRWLLKNGVLKLYCFPSGDENFKQRLFFSLR